LNFDLAQFTNIGRLFIHLIPGALISAIFDEKTTNKVIFLAETRLKTRAVHHRFWTNIVKVGRNFSKLAEFHPNRRRKIQPWVEFRPTWTIFDQNRGRYSTARV
jgi:hypothetical protein